MPFVTGTPIAHKTSLEHPENPAVPWVIWSAEWQNKSELPAAQGLDWDPPAFLTIYAGGLWQASAKNIVSTDRNPKQKAKFWFDINYFDADGTLIHPTWFVLRMDLPHNKPEHPVAAGNDPFIPQNLARIKSIRAMPMSDIYDF
jgi:hypothetical protein